MSVARSLTGLGFPLLSSGSPCRFWVLVLCQTCGSHESSLSAACLLIQEGLSESKVLGFSKVQFNFLFVGPVPGPAS